MSSRIATKFLTLPITETSISDMVWKYSDLNVADGIYCTPSLKYLQELITLLDGPKVTEIVSQVPSPNLLDSLFSEDCKSEVVKGIVLNPYTSLSTLSKIESLKPGESLLIKETRESHNKNFSESSSFSLRILEEYIENGNLSKFFAQVASFGERKMSELFKALYNYDQKLASLVILTSLETGNKIDLLMVDFIYRVKSFMNEAIIVKLESDFSNLVKLSSKLTPSALDFLIENGYVTVKKSVTPNSGTNESTARTLLATGLDEATVATLMVGSDRSDIDSTFLINTLCKASDGLVSQFVLGTTERKPRPTEIGMLFKALGTERVKKIVTENSEIITSLEWSEELILAAPLIEIKNLGLASTLRLFWSIENKLGKDIPAWELFLVMSEEWEDSIDSLMSSANIMSVLS